MSQSEATSTQLWHKVSLQDVNKWIFIFHGIQFPSLVLILDAVVLMIFHAMFPKCYPRKRWFGEIQLSILKVEYKPGRGRLSGRFCPHHKWSAKIWAQIFQTPFRPCYVPHNLIGWLLRWGIGNWRKWRQFIWNRPQSGRWNVTQKGYRIFKVKFKYAHLLPCHHHLPSL